MTSVPVAEPAVWRLAVMSWLPPRVRARVTARRVGQLPLMVIIGVQAAISVRLSNTAFQDEALYVSMGRWIRSGAAASNGLHPGRFFSGSPQLYPVFASYLDSVGGLALVRLFSTVCMLSCTLAVYWLTATLFNGRGLGIRPALFAAATFAFSAPVIFVGHFATFDAPAFACIAWASALAAWSCDRHRSLLWAGAVGVLAALAVALKYSAAADVPFVLLLPLVVANPPDRFRSALRTALAALTTGALLGLSALTWAADDLSGVSTTTTSRSLDSRIPAGTLLAHVWTWSGVAIALAVAGGLYVMRRRFVLAAFLLLGLGTAVGLQISSGDLVSLHKHVVLGLIFGAPLAGVGLAKVGRALRRSGSLVVCLAVWMCLLLGLSQSAELFRGWPNTTGLVQVLQYSFDDMPYLRTVGDVPEPVQYQIKGKTSPWQFTSTYADAFLYKGKRGLPAYQAALRNGYFQVAYFDGSTAIGRVLQNEMPSMRFTLAATLTEPNGHRWWIWHRFKDISD